MRLGDLDALENAIDKERQILIEQGRPGAEHIVVHHLRRLVEDAPTIDAIPIEFIRNKVQELENACDDSVSGDAGNLFSTIITSPIQYILDEWDKK